MSIKSQKITQIEGVSATELIEHIKEVVKELIPVQQPQPKEDKYLTRKEVCDLLKISVVTVHNWTKKGILNPLKIGNRLRFKESDVLNSLQSVNINKN